MSELVMDISHVFGWMLFILLAVGTLIVFWATITDNRGPMK